MGRLNQRGFTLVELMIVVAIISSLACIAVPHFTQAGDSATILKARTDLVSIDSALAAYMISSGSNTENLSLTQLRSAGYLPSEPKPPARLGSYAAGNAYRIDVSRTRAYLPLTGPNKSIDFYSDTDLNIK